MLQRSRTLAVLALLLIVAVWQVRTESQSTGRITTPAEAFGSAIGDDYFLATYDQLERYWQLVDRESDRVSLVDIGRTEEGRTQWMAVVSSPGNLARLERYRDISRRLALAEGVGDEEARALAAEGRAVVWIDGGLHADEVLGAQQLIETLYQLASRSDAETLRILQDVIVLLVHANPDGHQLVADWYMREPDPLRRRVAGVPRAYQKYVGHDNNRDFYMITQAETINMTRVLYREWFPQIVFDHHQTAPAGTVMFAPPFRGPFNYVFDPLIPVAIDLVGAAIHARLAAEGKPGATMRSGSNYSTWWNGGLRTTAYFHNQIGLLTETVGDPTPTTIPYVADRQLPHADLPFPVAPQPWRFRQSIEYELTANLAVLDIASRFREAFLMNAYRMARNAIDRGSRDTWTAAPARLGLRRGGGEGGARRDERALLRDPALRDPRGYVLPSNQPDFPTATKFVEALLRSGVAVHRASESFTIAGRSYPAGSYVVRTAQAFRPHVLDMFEPQEHPDDVAYAGGPPRAPYDNAGWTLAFQMGVKFDRILDDFSGPFEPITRATPAPADIGGAPRPPGYLLHHQQNDAAVAVNRLLAAGADVYWLRDRRVGGASEGTGSIYVRGGDVAQALLLTAAAELGITVTGVDAVPAGDALRLRPVRVALWDRYGGSSPSGWTRWLLERFEFPHEIVYAPALDAGNLRDRYDVILLTDQALGGVDPGIPAESVPEAYRHMLGRITTERTIPQLRRFVERGGVLVAIGGATAVGERMGVPVTSALTGRDGAGRQRPLPSTEFYIPGSIVRVSVDNSIPLAFGFERDVDVFFDASPVFDLRAEAGAQNVRRVAWFASPAPLRSGWAWGQHHLQGGTAVVDAPLGQGRVLLFGPEITYRAQAHGTFKFLFNAIHSARAEPVRLGDAGTR